MQAGPPSFVPTPEGPILGESSQRKLGALLPAGASATNPVDMIASAPAEHYRQAIEIVAKDENIDALIVIFTPPLVTRAQDVASIADLKDEH